MAMTRSSTTRSTSRSRRPAISTFTASSSGGASGPVCHSSHSAGRSSTHAIAKRSQPPQYTTSPTVAKTTCSSSSHQKRQTSTNTKSSAHGPTSSNISAARSRTTPRGTSTASSRSAHSRGSCPSSPARSTCSLPPRSHSQLSCAGRASFSSPCPSMRARARSESTFPAHTYATAHA
ncbi:hypothetical protein H4582DRAFT_970212 [Lactarius indigo]|nr:hypothetical protein H4582DRAFT_970212 [Lactarius indigo]